MGRQQPARFMPEPRQRELAYWLSDEASRYAPHSRGTALRSMASNRGQQRGMAGAALGTGLSFTGLGILGWATGGGQGLLIGLSGTGLVLALSGALVFRRIRQRRPPKIVDTMPSRGPGNFRSGLWAAAFFAAIFALISYPLFARLLERGPEGGALLIGYAVMVVTFLGSVFAVPAYFIQHAERDFRTDIGASPELRRTLEGLSLTWKDPVGTREFGPL